MVRAYSPGGHHLLACLLAEILLTLIFVCAILGTLDRRSLAGFAPIDIGMALPLIHLISIPITNIAVKASRSPGLALFAGETLGIGLKIKYPDKTVAGWMGSRVGGMLFKRNSLTQSSWALLSCAYVGGSPSRMVDSNLLDEPTANSTQPE
ncbi:MAG: aquaporin [Cyanobacteria bacterium P01_H01_bin.152]